MHLEQTVSQITQQRQQPRLPSLIIKNLSKTTFNLDLFLFCKRNNVVPVKASVSMDKEGNHRGYGWLTFKSQEEAEEALSKLNNQKLDNQEVIVMLDKK